MKFHTQLMEHPLITLLLAALPVALLIVLVACNGQKKTEEPKKAPVSYVKHPDWSINANIYEVNVRQYTPEGTFAAFEDHLPRLKTMGVDILWFMPIHPIGEKNRKGTLGSYYSVQDYKGVNPEFGTMEDFKHLVREAHGMGMKVIIDWVANHSAWDNPWIFDHPEWYAKDSLGQMIAPFDWTDVAKLDYENKDMRAAMIDALKFWVTEADIDGYRCDVAEHVPTDFWEAARAELDATKPVFMLAEAEVPEHHKKAFDMSYAWELHHLMNKMAKGEAPADTLDTYFAKQDSLYPPSAYRMNFTSNHDENSWNGTEYERMGDGALTFAVLSATLPGMPLIYSGQEAALNKRLEFFEKDTIDWNDYPLGAFYTRLLSLKKENEALWNGESGGSMTRIHTNKDKSVFAFAREKDGKMVVAIFNLTGQPVKFKLRGSGAEGDYQDWAAQASRSLKAGEQMNFKPWEYLVLIK